MKADLNEIPVRRLPVRGVRALRHALLRPERPPSASVYPTDEDPTAAHFGAFAGDRLVGVASLFEDPLPGYGAAGRAWRIRGMATRPAVRGQGFGAALLRACLSHAAENSGGQVWCNARPGVVGFYERYGFTVLTRSVDVQGHGQRVRMVRRLGGGVFGEVQAVG